MKALTPLVALAVLGAGFVGPAKSQGPSVTLVVAGDTLGYLAPCGCTKPMAGGIERWASAVRTAKSQGKVQTIVNGGLVSGTSRQDELKAETLAESYRAVGASAIHMTRADSRLGVGMTQAVTRLAGAPWVTTSLPADVEGRYERFVPTEEFLIGGLDPLPNGLAADMGTKPLDGIASVRDLIQEAETLGLAPVLMYAGSRDEAREIAEKNPRLAAIVYRASTPSPTLETVGTVALLTPGEHGKFFVSVGWDGSTFSAYRAVTLWPTFEPDPDVARIRGRYNSRVADEGLLDALPRSESEAFAGNKACTSCHVQEGEVWHASAHAKALKTLDDVHQERDPDCVGCHVVALESTQGFRSRSATPELANVGCESCHGPGKRHTEDPSANKLGKIGEKSCMKCHVPDHSPNFDFQAYWEKIKH